MTGPVVYCEVWSERVHQDKQWGGPGHDDLHDQRDWREFIKQQLRRQQEWPEMHVGSAEEFESRMIKVAALAIAAVESSRRKRGFTDTRNT